MRRLARFTSCWRAAVSAACAAMALLLQAGAHAADAATCAAYVKEATAKAHGIRQFNCSFDLNDPRWSPRPSGHATWCKSADKDTVERETARRRGEIKLCQTCRSYADLAVAAAADNVRLKCGYKGPRWGDKASDHFEWCVEQHGRISADEKDAKTAYKVAFEKTRKLAAGESGARQAEFASCKPDLRRKMGESRPPLLRQ
jgi:hypothetical protein